MILTGVSESAKQVDAMSDGGGYGLVNVKTYNRDLTGNFDLGVNE